MWYIYIYTRFEHSLAVEEYRDGEWFSREFDFDGGGNLNGFSPDLSSELLWEVPQLRERDCHIATICYLSKASNI